MLLKCEKHNNYHHTSLLTSAKSPCYRYGFKGQEIDREWLDGAVSFTFRVHDPRICRLLSMDPLVASYPFFSPYAFSGNRIMDARELEGLEPISIHTQSFIPFKTLGMNGPGGDFSGDNRGFGEKGKSRISAVVDMNLSGKGIKQGFSKVKGANTYDSEGNFLAYSDAKWDNAPVMTNSKADGQIATASIGFAFSGNNEGINLPSPDIDVKASISLGVLDHDDGSSTIVISGTVFGDKFPANETYITDKKGQRIFLGVSGADGTPLKNLPGDNNRTMQKFTVKVNFDADEKATSVDYNGTNYSIADWNKKFTSLDATDGTVATDFDD